MFISIKKIKKKPIFFYHSPTGHDIRDSIGSTPSSTESVMVVHLISLNNRKVQDIMGGSDSLKQELDSFGISDLAEYFLKYPSAWYELKRKLHSLKIKTTNGKVGKEHEEEIVPVFLRLNRGEINPESLENSWRTEILENQKLLGVAFMEPSFLDSSHDHLDLLSLKQKKSQRDFIKKLIELGIRSNIDISEGEIDSTIKKLLPQITYYLESIFEIRIPSNIPITLNTLSKWIADKIWGTETKGVEIKNLWTFIKAFRAWGGYEEIETYYNKSKKNISLIPEKFQSHGFLYKPTEPRKDISFNDEIDIECGELSMTLSSGKSITLQIEHRLKSMRSILLKLWESEDYNNIDAMRDMIGVAIVFPVITAEEKIEVITKMTTLFADKGYMAKNKNLFQGDDLKNLKAELKGSSRRPLGTIAAIKKDKSSEGFENASLSGFTKLGSDPVGLEIQFFDEKGYKFWKDDHITFDPLKVVGASSRGYWFLTPLQLLNCVRMNIKRDILDTKRKFPQDIIQEYIHKGLIMAFSGKNGEIYFVPKKYEKNFREKFLATSIISKTDPELKTFIKNLSSRSTL